MIIKSSQRAGAKELALHLNKEVDIDGHPQTVHITDSRYLLQENDLSASLQDMEIMSKVAPRCQKHLYHVSVSPDTPMSAAEWDVFWETYETEFSLQNLAYIEVTHDHLNHDRPPHKHRVYERVDTTLEKAVELSHTKIRNEKIARILEYEFGHPLTIGKHNRAIIFRLQEEGREDIAQWMKAGRAHQVDRPIAQKDHTDYQQEKRTQIPVEQIKTDLQTAWKQTDSGRAFAAAIAEKGYILARGDRRDFIIVDTAGGIHSPRRRLNVKAKDIRQRLADLNPDGFPTAEQLQQERRGLPKIDKTDPDTALHQLEKAKAQTEAQIAQLEAELKRTRAKRQAQPTDTSTPFTEVAAEVVYDREIAKIRANPASDQPPDSVDKDKLTPPIDQRRIIAELSHWQQIADRESVKPQAQASDWNEAKAWGISKDTLATMQTNKGSQATEERERRIEVALHAQPDPQKPVLSAYLMGLKERLKEKGRRYYRTADRWLTERLAKLGYSRGQAKRALATASPELMNKQPTQRVSYIRQLVDRVYQVWERERRAKHETEKRESKSSKASEYSKTSNSKPELGKPQPAKTSKAKCTPKKNNPKPRRPKR